MPQAFALVRPAAHTTPAANDGALPTSPDLIQLHLAATNSLAAALRLLRTSDCTPTDLHRATGRAIQAARALKRASSLTSEGVAA